VRVGLARIGSPGGRGFLHGVWQGLPLGRRGGARTRGFAAPRLSPGVPLSKQIFRVGNPPYGTGHQP
jgi:hypothetical protein